MSRFKRTNPAERESFQEAPSKKRELVTDDPGRELSIDEDNLNQELMDQPLLFRKWTRMLSQVSKKAKAIKNKLEYQKALAVSKYASDGTGKKVREIEAAITLDAEVARLENELLDAEELVEEYTGIVKAFYQRHEMLKDLCANKRREFID